MSTAVPDAPANVPDGCTCTYLAWTRDSDQARRWERKLNWGCPADHAEVDRGAVLVADSERRNRPGEDAKFVKAGVISASEIRRMRYDPDDGDGDGVRL